jgi:hypothetical protein
MTTIKKLTIALLALAIIGVTTAPMVYAEKERPKNPKAISAMSSINVEGENNSIFSNSAARDARTAYQKAVKNAKTAYQIAVKAARNKLTSAFSLAKGNFMARLSAYRIYLTDLSAARAQKSTATETALQTYINALSNITVTP